MEKDMLIGLLSNLAPGSSAEVGDDIIDAVFPPGTAAGLIDERSRSRAAEFANGYDCVFSYDGNGRRGIFTKRANYSLLLRKPNAGATSAFGGVIAAGASEARAKAIGEVRFRRTDPSIELDHVVLVCHPNGTEIARFTVREALSD